MSRDLPSLDGLNVLGAVVEAGSFVRAGEALGLTQSAVSRAVARLEERLGIRMFLRTARSISLTDDGRRFYASVAPHLAAIVDAATEAGGSASKVRGRLRVRAGGDIGPMMLAPRLPELLAQHPDLSIEMTVTDRTGDLVRDGVDVDVRFGTPGPSALKARLLMRTRVITCASPAYLARHGTPRQPKDVEQHECILMRDPATGSHFAWDLVRGKKTVHLEVAGQLQVNDGRSLMVACEAGHGIAQTLELYARPLIAEGKLVQVLPHWSDETYPLYAFHHAVRVQSAKVRAFLDFVVAVTRETQ